MNKEELIKILRKSKKSEAELDNAKSLDSYVFGFGVGYNKAIDELIELIENEEIQS